MTQLECDKILILKLKKDISEIIEKYTVIPESEVSKIVETCILPEDTGKDTHRLVIQWQDSYYKFKGNNVVFQPIKFVKLLLSISVLLSEFNHLTIINIFCDVLEIFFVKLSQNEATVLLFLYQVSSAATMNDENIYDSYLKYIAKREFLMLDKKIFYSTLQKLCDNKLIVIDNGNYFVVDKIIGKNKKD